MIEVDFWGPERDDSGPENEPRPLRETLPRVLEFLAPHWPSLALTTVLTLVLSTLWLAGPVLTSLIIDRAILDGDTRLLVVLCLCLMGVALATSALGILQDYLLLTASEKVVRSVRSSLFEALQNQLFRVNHSCRLCDIHSCRSDSTSVSRFWAALVL